MKSWKLEGSIDLKNWNVLHSKNNVETLSTSQGGSYQITKNNSNIYKFLRITQTGPTGNTEKDNYKCRLRIRYFDFFGLFSNRIALGIHKIISKRISINIFVYIFIFIIKN